MKSLRTLVLIFLLAIVFQSQAMATSGIAYVGWISTDLIEEASITIIPDGSGRPLSEACYFGGEVADASIRIGLTDINGDAVLGFPREDVWLQWETGNLTPCLWFTADADSDMNGEMTFTGSLAGGGWCQDHLWVYLNGDRANHPNVGELDPIPLRVVSPDVNGDGEVNLGDLGMMVQLMYQGYDYRLDFHWDGVINLLDVGRFATAFGASCQ